MFIGGAGSCYCDFSKTNNDLPRRPTRKANIIYGAAMNSKVYFPRLATRIHRNSYTSQLDRKQSYVFPKRPYMKCFAI